jgi:hypothetical protein
MKSLNEWLQDEKGVELKPKEQWMQTQDIDMVEVQMGMLVDKVSGILSTVSEDQKSAIISKFIKELKQL